MIIKHKEQRVGIFIDTQNLYHSAKNLFGHKVNFAKIVEDALAGRKLIRSIAYVITSEAGDEQGFFEALNKNGIETKTKDLQVFMGGAKKGDWDVGLAVDAITLAPKIDAAIIISGDGDFVPLVQYLQIHSGIQVEVVSFAKSASQRLIESCNDFMDLTLNPEKYLIGYRPRKQSKRKQGGKPTGKPNQKQNPKSGGKPDQGGVTISRAVPK